MKFLERYKKLVERILASDYCKKIICMNELTRKTFLWHLDCTGFEHKLETVYRVVHPKDFLKSYHDNKIKLLFVGSANFPREFEDEKGGTEALAVFTLLNQKYDNLELVIRSDVPREIKAEYGQMANVRIIDKVISWEEMEQEFKTADIFLLPAHHTPSLAFLDAMSYELPVVTIDSWGNSEIVEDGKTGFVVSQPDGFQLPIADFLPDRKVTPVKKAKRAVNPQVVQELVEKTSLLIENRELRRQMGKAARCEVEQGKFSIERRNGKLKRIFDEATA
jgi:glycosyltransferase involved in cell wall biosynthesis